MTKQMGLQGWHWSSWTLIHWSEIIKRSKIWKVILNFFSECCHPFQVDGLVIFLTMIRNNGECMLTSLAVREGSIFLALYLTT